MLNKHLIHLNEDDIRENYISILFLYFIFIKCMIPIIFALMLARKIVGNFVCSKLLKDQGFLICLLLEVFHILFQY